MTEFASKTIIENNTATENVERVQDFKASVSEKVGRAVVACMLGAGIALTTFAAEEIVDQDHAVAYNSETGGYPWTDATELNRSNSDYGYADCPSDASGCKNNTLVKGGVAYGVYDPWGYYFRNCTSYIAWRLNQEFGVNASDLRNAKSWDDRAPSKDWDVDKIPEIGDVAVWGGGTYGHVAFVEEIGSGGDTGKVRVAEYNQGLDGNFRNDRWVSTGGVSNFIDVNGPNTADFKLKIGEGGTSYRPQETNTIPWSFTTLEGNTNSLSGYNADTGQTPAAVEFNDKLYAFSYDNSGGNLRMASSANGTGWNFITMEGDPGSLSKYNANVGQAPAVVVYNDTLHAYYYSVDGGNLRHAWSPNGVNWAFETLDGVGGSNGRRNANIGQTPTVEVYNNAMQVFYRDVDNKALRHAWTSSSQGWRFEDLEGMPGSISHYTADIGHDPDAEVWNNQLHLYYYDKTKENLRHAWTGSGQGWRFENLDGDKGSVCGQDAKTGKNPSVTAHGDTMQLLYYNESGGDLRHAWTGKVQGWRCETLEGDDAAALGYDSVVGSMPTIASIGGNLQAFAYQPEWGALRHYWWDRNGTRSENFDGLGGLPIGRQNAWTGLDPVVVPFNDKVYAFYYGSGSGDLRLAISK